MNFFQINKWLHSYDLSCYNYVKKNEFYFNKFYEENKPNNHLKGVNVPLEDGEIYNIISQNLLKIILQNYYVSPNHQNHSLGIYKQDNTNNIRNPHNHILSASITSVFYINPPKSKEGGGITLYFSNLNEYITIHPIPGKVYFFPSWVYHTPEPQTSPTPRFSINWGYMSRIRPIHKITGDLW
tara:strand:+ start:47 stop:595 length:549 start_codon:yes stop_codon:yes gene_type:complete